MKICLGKQFLDFSQVTKNNPFVIYGAVQTLKIHYIYTQIISDGIWVLVKRHCID